MSRMVYILGAYMTMSCNQQTVPALPEATPYPTQLDPTCYTSCQHLQDMGCLLGHPTANGADCTAVCTAAASNGLNWPLFCIELSGDCETAELCR